jgi:PAS domain S-box-containing protein
LLQPDAIVPDYSALFDATPSPCLVLAPDFSIVAVNQAYLEVTRMRRADILGRHLFNVFPDNPQDPHASGAAKLQASLERVLHDKCADTMAIQKYDLPVHGPDGMVFEERYWSPVNTPVFDARGEVIQIIHCVEDVTEFIKTNNHAAQMKSTIDDQALQIKMANRRLREANEALASRVVAQTEAQRQAEERLRETELRFRLLTDAIPQMVWIADAQGHATFFNQQWTNYTGQATGSTPAEEIAASHLHPDDEALTIDNWHAALKAGRVFNVEQRIRSASGEYRWFLVRAEPYRDPVTAEIACWFGTSTDIHDYKMGTVALEKSEERYRALFNSIDEGYCIIEMLFDENGRAYDYRFCETNPSFQQQTGLFNAVGKTIRELAPDHESYWYDMYGQVATTGESVRFQHEARALNRWFDVFASRIEKEEHLRVAVVFKDTTDQKRMTDTLRQSEQAAIEAARQAEAERHRLDALLQAVPVGIVVSDGNGAIVLSNATHKHLWGEQHPDARNIDEFSEWKGWWADHSDRHGQRLASHEWTTARILAGEAYPRDIVTIESFDVPAVRRTVLITGAPIRTARGKIVGAVVAQMDIGDRIKAEDALRQADRRKDEFLAMLAHELRNPLAPIGAAAELLQMMKLDEQQVRQTSQIIGRQVNHMTSLVDDLLDVSRVTRGLVKMDHAPLDVSQIVADAIEQATPLIRERRHHLAMHLTPDAAMVQGDKKRLIQVLANILNNAAKYTPEGGHIQMRTAVRDAHVLIEVSDDGIGMAPDLVSRAFDLFAQAERTSDRSSGGLGLGLALVRSLVELHHGTVTCESEGIGKGSRFTICLPRLAAQDRHGAARYNDGVSQTQMQPLRILVVDDNVDAAAMLAMLLEAFGHTVLVEHGARRALERARIEAPQVCLLDIGLPEMDGIELAQRLRVQPETARCVLIAVSGYGQDQDRAETLAAGFDHHLVKPVNTRALASILAAITRR